MLTLRVVLVANLWRLVDERRRVRGAKTTFNLWTGMLSIIGDGLMCRPVEGKRADETPWLARAIGLQPDVCLARTSTLRVARKGHVVGSQYRCPQRNIWQAPKTQFGRSKTTTGGRGA